MAPKKSVKPKPVKEKPAKPARKETRETPGAGHNAEKLRDLGQGVVEEFLKLSADMESDMAGYRSDFAKMYERAAGELGLKKSVLTAELKRILKRKKEEQKEKELAPDERQQTEIFRDAMAGTAFGDWAAGVLAAPDATE